VRPATARHRARASTRAAFCNVQRRRAGTPKRPEGRPRRNISAVWRVFSAHRPGREVLRPSIPQRTRDRGSGNSLITSFATVIDSSIQPWLVGGHPKALVRPSLAESAVGHVFGLAPRSVQPVVGAACAPCLRLWPGSLLGRAPPTARTNACPPPSHALTATLTVVGHTRARPPLFVCLCFHLSHSALFCGRLTRTLCCTLDGFRKSRIAARISPKTATTAGARAFDNRDRRVYEAAKSIAAQAAPRVARVCRRAIACKQSCASVPEITGLWPCAAQNDPWPLLDSSGRRKDARSSGLAGIERAAEVNGCALSGLGPRLVDGALSRATTRAAVPGGADPKPDDRPP